LDPYNVIMDSVFVRNVADIADRLAENQIAKIEVVRARDGASMGSITNLSGLNTGGVRILTPNNNLTLDDTEEEIELWVTLKTGVPHNRFIRLETDFWHTENERIFTKGDMAGQDSALFETGPEVGQGFEEAAATELTAREVFQGARFLAQELKLEDDDVDPYGVTVTSLMVRNMAPDNRLADTSVARLEVRRKSDGKLLGEVVDPVGLSLAGVRVATLINNAVLDDAIVELQIWLTLKQTIPFGRKIKLESIVWNKEGTATFDTEPLAGPTTFTTAEGDPPTNVEFDWTPEAPTFEDEISFVPAGDIADPEGDIANATFAWDFGDNSDVVETTGTAEVTHTYAGGGTFDVTLTVTGEDGLTSDATETIVVEGPPNQAPEITDITATPANPAVDDDVDFEATIVDPDQAAGAAFEYAWEFGDADDSTSTVAGPRFSYDTAGTYTVTLTVTDAQGATDTRTLEISVGNEPPEIDEVVVVTTGELTTGNDIAFAATGVTDPDGDDIDHFEWNFGDGRPPVLDGQSTAEHMYGAPGTYTVTVVAVDDRGGRSEPKTEQITVAGPTKVVMHAFPNPASTTATISYYLPDGATGPELWIFDLDRSQVLREPLAAGETEFEWTLRTKDGDAVSNGLYFCIITATKAAGGTTSSDVFLLLVAR